MEPYTPNPQASDPTHPPTLPPPRYDLNKILHMDDLVRGDDVFFAATGVSDGDLLRGVRYVSGGAISNSIVMRCKSGTVRFIETFHKWTKPSLTNVGGGWHGGGRGSGGGEVGQHHVSWSRSMVGQHRGGSPVGWCSGWGLARVFPARTVAGWCPTCRARLCSSSLSNPGPSGIILGF